MPIRIMIAGLVLLMLVCLPVQAKKGASGLHISEERAGGIFNPVMSRLFVQAVDEGSCAERSGFVAGDEIVTIEKNVVAGKKARELMAYWKSLNTDVGVHFTVKRGDASLDLLLCGPSTR